MKEGEAHVQVRRTSGNSNEPAIQVICLGSGGGPSEDNVTGFLVRSTGAKWAKNSVLALDAGSHLAAITRILEEHFPLVTDRSYKTARKAHSNDGNGRYGAASSSPGTAPMSDEDSGPYSSSSSDESAEQIWTTLAQGAFAGLPFPNSSARANALHVVREHVSTYLITHPHLDHVSGFVINTAAFHNTSRPKRLAALPFTVNAIKTHIFNNIVWPNLTDEDGGVGLVTFQRLAEGGNIALGEGSGRGYIEVCDGLSVRGFKVSHGHCMKGPHAHRGSVANIPPSDSPAMGIHRASTLHNFDHSLPMNDVGREQRSHSFSLPAASGPGTPLFTGQPSSDSQRHASVSAPVNECTIDSSAYFIRAESTQSTPTKEVLFFGDVEPDSISHSPRNFQVWAEAAPKIAAGLLAGIFIECSYTNIQGDAVLYGHLAPRHLLQELGVLAELVKDARRDAEIAREEARKGRKRKRASNGLLQGINSFENSSSAGETARKSSRTRSYAPVDDDAMTDYAKSPTPARHSNSTPGTLTPKQNSLPQQQGTALNLSSVSAEHSKALLTAAFDAPLKGVKVVVIHIKDTLADGPLVGESILNELTEGEREMSERGRGLGCVFEAANSGGSYWF